MTIPATGALAKTISIDTILITGYQTNLITKEGPNIVVQLATGYMKEEKFVPVENYQHVVTGEALERVYAESAELPGAAILDRLYAEVANVAPTPGDLVADKLEEEGVVEGEAEEADG